jgi:hypothetical protein
MPMKALSLLCGSLALMTGVSTVGCDKEGAGQQPHHTTETAALPVPEEAGIGKEPPVIAIIREAEAQEKIRREAREQVEALPKHWTPGSPPDPEVQRLMTRQMEAKMKVEDHVAQLKAYQGTPLEQKLAAEYVRRAELWHQVRIQQILVAEAGEAQDETKRAEAKELLALRLAEVKKSEDEWLAVEKGGWKQGD